MNHHDIADAVNKVYRNQKVKNAAKGIGQFLIVLIVLVLLFLGVNSLLDIIFSHKIGWVHTS